MSETTTRFAWLVGQDKADLLTTKSVAVFGCGGVGSFAVEALVRSGIGKIIIIDGDEVDITNLNRQNIATYDTVGMRKVDAARERCQAVNKNVEIETYDLMYTHEAYPDFFEKLNVDYVVDAVDMITAKIDIIVECKKYNIPVISSMGMGNKLDPTKIEIVDIAKTSVCPLAKVMRKAMKERRISKVPVVYTTEQALVPKHEGEKRSPGSCAFVPSVAGMAMASYVIRQLLGIDV